MNGALVTITAGTHNAGLNRGAREIHNVGAYLKAFAGATRRLHGYGARLKQVAAKM